MIYKKAVVIQQPKEVLDVLQSNNFNLLNSNDCIDGIRKIIRYRPDIVVTKLNTPHLSAISLLGILKLFHLPIPVILTLDNPKDRGKIQSHPNLAGIFMENDVAYKLDELLTTEKKFKEHYPSVDKYSYSLRQHEWSDLLITSTRKKILHVDDSDSIRKLCMIKLDSSDEYELYSAKDGLDGILKSLLIKPDLILSDIDMPILSGLAMSQIFFVLDKPFPIVFLSVHEDEQTKRKAKNIDGVIGYMDKSVLRDKKDFLRQIDIHIKMADTLRESLNKTYHDGLMNTLLTVGEDEGVLKKGFFGNW